MEVHVDALVASQANNASAHAARAKAINALQRSFFVCSIEIISSTILMVLYCMYECMCGHTYSKSTDQPGNVANPARRGSTIGEGRDTTISSTGRSPN